MKNEGKKEKNMEKEIKAEIREMKKYMRKNGITRMSCFNGGHSPESYRCNSELFRLDGLLRKAKKEN